MIGTIIVGFWIYVGLKILYHLIIKGDKSTLTKVDRHGVFYDK